MKIHGRIFCILSLVTILFSMLPLVGARAQAVRPVIVISPGHGWWVPEKNMIDPGAVSGDLIEKDINLEVARYVRDYLERCPVDVYLTRDADDPDHTLYDVDEIVNAYQPTVAISIHTNSDTGNPSGTEGWYTVGGYDDVESQALAASLADHIASRLGIKDLGTQPETSNRHGGLYIHWWKAPSALIEIAYLQGDAELIRTEKDQFGRSIAQALLEYVDIDPHCADQAVPQGVYLSTFFPWDTQVSEITLRNDGLVAWTTSEYALVSLGETYGAQPRYELTEDTPADQEVMWYVPAVAPDDAGIYRQQWQLYRRAEPVDKKVTVYMIVVPEAARELKEKIDQQIAEWRQQGEEELDALLQRIEQELVTWAMRELPKLPDLICGQNLALFGLAAGTSLIYHRKRNPLIPNSPRPE